MRKEKRFVAGGEMSEGKKTSLRELVDLNELQAIQDSFAKTVGTSSVILSPEGEPSTQFSNPTGFCTLIQSTEEGKRRCFLSFMEMSQKALELEEPVIQYCFADGGHFVAPIIIDGEHKGTMFAGQFIPQTFSAEQLKALERIAVEINVDPMLLIEEAKKMRVVEEDRVWNYSSLLFQIVAFITRLGVQANELNRAKDALQKAHDGLENRVQERTAELAKTNEELKHEISERKNAEEALRESEEKYRNLVETIKEQIWEVDANGVYTYMSPTARDVYGLEPEELVGKTPFDLMPPGEAERMAGVFKKIAESHEPFSCLENVAQRKDGRQIVMETTGVPFFASDGTLLGYRGTARDITERKRAEERLSESETRFRELFDNMSSGVAVYEAKEGGKDFVFIDFNHAAEKIENIKKEDLLGKSVLEVFPGVMDFGLFHVFQRVWHTGKPEHHPISFYKDERIVGWRENYVYKLPSGEIVTVYEDITERKQAEDALRESEEKVRSITASAQDAVIMVDNEETITFWNEAAERIFGYTEEEMIGTKLHSAIIPKRFHEDALTGFKSFRETGQGAAVGKTLELAANRKDGTEFPIELSLSAVKLKGKWYGIGVIRDISEVRKKTEAMKRFNKLAVGRELRMIELKKEINALLEDLGKEARYKIAGEGGR
jgi:PAS domain S-box-containing protein